jgi:hypothetical protein
MVSVYLSQTVRRGSGFCHTEKKEKVVDVTRGQWREDGHDVRTRDPFFHVTRYAPQRNHAALNFLAGNIY